MSQFMDELRDKIRVKQYSYKTERAHLNWTEWYIRSQGIRHPKEMGREEVAAFLTHLAKSGVSASTQNQALAAILFMYREMPGERFENIQAVRAKRSTHIPPVLTIWFGCRGLNNFMKSTYRLDGKTFSASWQWPGGGYSFK
jgi:site-specific recombinase XerD